MSALDFAYGFICDNEKKSHIIYRQTALPRHLTEILNMLKKDERAIIFLNKVNKKDAPNYYDIITNPMDLGTVAKKIHLYRNIDEFKKDLDLIWSNCLIYNTAEYYIKCANEMKELADSLIRIRHRSKPLMLESKTIEGIPIKDCKKDLERTVAMYLHLIGFQRCEKNAIKIICDILDFKICQEIKKMAKDS